MDSEPLRQGKGHHGSCFWPYSADFDEGFRQKSRLLLLCLSNRSCCWYFRLDLQTHHLQDLFWYVPLSLPLFCLILSLIVDNRGKEVFGVQKLIKFESVSALIWGFKCLVGFGLICSVFCVHYKRAFLIWGQNFKRRSMYIGFIKLGLSIRHWITWSSVFEFVWTH